MERKEAGSNGISPIQSLCFAGIPDFTICIPRRSGIHAYYEGSHELGSLITWHTIPHPRPRELQRMTDRWTHASPDPIAVNLRSSLTPSMPSNIVSSSHSLSSSSSLPATIIAEEDDGSDSDSDADSGSDSGSDADDEDQDSDIDSGDEDSERDSDSSNESSDDDSDGEDELSPNIDSRETVSALPQEQLSAIPPTATVSNSNTSSLAMPTSPRSDNSSADSAPSQSASSKTTLPGSSSAPNKSTQEPSPSGSPSGSSSSPSHASAAPQTAAKSAPSTEVTSSPSPSPSPSAPSQSGTSSSEDPPHTTSSSNVMESLKQSQPRTSDHPSSSSSPFHSASVNVQNSTTSVHNSTSSTVSTSSSHSIASSTNSISSTAIPSHTSLNEPQGIVSTGPEATTVPSSHPSNGFFSDHSLVAGVFVAVTVVILIILGLLPWLIARCRRRKRNQSPRSELMISRPNPFPYDDETHYKRASQMRAFGDVLSAGASRPVSDASDGSHTPTHDSNHSNHSHHSTAPMIQRNTKISHPAALLPSYSSVHPNFPLYNDAKLPIFDLPRLPRDAGAFQVEPISLVRENTFYPQTVNENIRHRYSLPAHNNLRVEEKNDGEQHHIVTPKSLRTVPLLNLPRPHEETAVTRLETPRNSALLTPPESGRPIIPPRNPRRLTISSSTLRPPPKIFPNPLMNQSQHSVAQSSPSIYPPTLPGEDGHEAEDEYWQKQGFERVAFSSSDKPVHHPFRQSTTESSLGLQLGHHDNSSETTIGPGHKTGLAHQNASFSNGHRRAPSIPPDVLISDGRYPLLAYRATRF